jgi:acetyltransferase-like isoleucine patch superfamily enzyme
VVQLVREIIPTIRRGAGPRLRWRALQKAGVVVVGDHTYGFPNIYSWGDDTKLHIGKYCSIAEGVVIVLGGEHRMDWVTTFPFSALARDWPPAKQIKGHPSTKGDVVIGNDVWIGQGALILSGVTIGDGAVIGAGSVVTKDVKDYAIAAGNPAKFVKFRFDQATRIGLKKLLWWNWSDEKVVGNMGKLMCTPEESGLLSNN